jgi:phosphoribosyl 1,2-cyclic phosphodiesterase
MTTRYGGNSVCVQVQPDEGTHIVLDCGTGARPLGLTWSAAAPSALHLLLTHYHWDHIQGLPFFNPAYNPGIQLHIYGPKGIEETMEAILTGQMRRSYFPIQWGDLRAQIIMHEIGEGVVCIGGCTVHTQWLNHTSPCLGYRLEAGNARIVYATDHEPFAWAATISDPAARVQHPGDRRHEGWLAGADLLIHDAQYTEAEYATRRGWGHSPMEYVADLAALAGVKRLALFHHDPARSDRQIAPLVRALQRRTREQGSPIEIIAAAEGMELMVPERTSAMLP